MKDEMGLSGESLPRFLNGGEMAIDAEGGALTIRSSDAKHRWDPPAINWLEIMLDYRSVLTRESEANEAALVAGFNCRDYYC
jgi:hypothetical protein